MDIMVLDKNFNILGVLDNYDSIVWNRKYYETGSFTIQTAKFDFTGAKYIWSKDLDETGIVQTIDRKTNTSTSTIVSGKFLEETLENLCIHTTEQYTGYGVNIVKTIMAKYYPDITIAETTLTGNYISTSFTGETIGEAIRKILEPNEMSFKLTLDYQTNGITFTVYQGTDRTQSQDVNAWAVFGTDNETILSNEYKYDDSTYKNYAVVAGEGEGAERTIVIVDNRTDTTEEIKELYVDANDLTSADITQEVYLENLKQRGLEKLQDYKLIQKVDFSVDTTSVLEYHTNYDLGDKVTYKETNGYLENRITEITYSIEGGNTIIDVTFGNTYNLKGVFN